jgi:hypothetical protein
MMANSRVLILFICVLSGCAANPESIPPSYVSELSYQQYSCEQLGQEQVRMSSALATASDAQRRARSNDTAGVILLGLPVSSLSGSNQASNIGRLKGEMEAIQRAGTLKNCGLPRAEMPNNKNSEPKPKVRTVDGQPVN